MVRTRMGVAAAVVLALALLLPTPAAIAAGPLPVVASPPPANVTPGAYIADHLIVRWREGTSRAQAASVLADQGFEVIRSLGLPGLQLLRVHGEGPRAAAARLAANPHVEYAEPDYLLTPTADPTTDTYFGQEWGLNNTGQAVNGTSGTAGVDIGFLAASAVSMGDPKVVVAVIDDGVDLTHPDLVDRAWTNPGESGNGKETNGIDDDGNGYIDDVHGWNFVNGDPSVHKVNQDFHGTHVAGTIAASVNGLGVVGVAPQVEIMALKFIGPSGGSTADAIDAINYAAANGAQIMNASWDGPDFSQALKDAIAASGLLMVAAAGNDGADIDTSGQHSYPASYDLNNIVSVAAIDQNGQLASFSNYGTTSVDISAPGVNILSDYPATSSSPPALAYLDGTSMATPHVSGVAALMVSVRPWLASYPGSLRMRLLRSGMDLPATHGLTATGRVVNAFRALDFESPTVATPDLRLAWTSATQTGKTSVKVTWDGSDAGSGLDHYRLQKRTDGGDWQGVWLPGPLTESVVRALEPGHTYQFRVRAWDQAGNSSAWMEGPAARLVLRNEGSPSISYTGTWTRPWVSSAIWQRLQRTDEPAATATMSFTGRSIAWIAERGPGHGVAVVYVNGWKAATVDLEAGSLQPRRVVFARTWSSSSVRTIEIRTQGTDGRPTVTLDAFAFLR